MDISLYARKTPDQILANLFPKEVDIGGDVFIIHKIPAVQGRELAINYPISIIPKVGNYEHNEELMQKLLSYVYKVTSEGAKIRLIGLELIGQHMMPKSSEDDPWENLIKLESEVITYNFSFFRNGGVSASWRRLTSAISEKSMKILTVLLDTLSRKDSPPSKN